MIKAHTMEGHMWPIPARKLQPALMLGELQKVFLEIKVKSHQEGTRIFKVS